MINDRVDLEDEMESFKPFVITLWKLGIVSWEDMLKILYSQAFDD